MRISRLKITNYRALRSVELRNVLPLTVLCGANGSGKSTMFDAFAFLNEAFTTGLRGAWDSRNRIDSIRSRGADGPVGFELAYRAPDFEDRQKLVTYTLEVDQRGLRPVVVSERMRWSTAPGSGRPREILTFSEGSGTVYDEQTESYSKEDLASPDLLAVSALGQFRQHPRVKVLRDFITGWYLSYVNADGTRTSPNAGPEPRLSQSGDNLANVIQYLQESHPKRLATIFEALSARIPRLESVLPSQLDDGRLLLRLKDRPFDEPVLSKYASDGTLKLLAYLAVLYDPDPAAVIGIEEPENQLHPRLVPVLIDEIRGIAARSQVLVTTHSRDLLNGVRPTELWLLSRGVDGFTVATRASEDERAMAMHREGAQLGELWAEGYLRAGDPAHA